MWFDQAWLTAGAPVHPKGVKILKVEALRVTWFYISLFHFIYMFEAALPGYEMS